MHKTAVKDKISLAAKSGPGQDRRTALRAELDGIRSQQSGNKASRGRILDQLKALQENIQKKVLHLSLVVLFIGSVFIYFIRNQGKDLQAAKSIAHDTVFENYDRLTKVFPIRGKVLSYCAFISQHPHFVVVGAYNHPQGWLLRKLDMDGAALHIIGSYGGITEEAQIYDARVLDTHCSNFF